ncbi:MAG: hypothetical protein WC777_04120 [Candidatus Gracilibacteria bacterium]|jgi:hypothetical protein
MTHEPKQSEGAEIEGTTPKDPTIEGPTRPEEFFTMSGITIRGDIKTAIPSVFVNPEGEEEDAAKMRELASRGSTPHI